MKLVLATRNAHKARELEALLAPHDVLALPADVRLPPETGDTFAANALDKARAAARATGLPAIGDDSGIEAAALGGAPGVRSARFAGEAASDEENLRQLLREAPAGSAVAYVCALAYVGADGAEQLVEGRCSGALAAVLGVAHDHGSERGRDLGGGVRRGVVDDDDLRGRGGLLGERAADRALEHAGPVVRRDHHRHR